MRSFKYLGSSFSSEGGSQVDVKVKVYEGVKYFSSMKIMRNGSCMKEW